MQNLHQHNLEAVQSGGQSSSTDGDLFNYNAMQQTILNEVTTASDGAQVSSVPDRKEKKDSKTEGLIEEDGVSLKGFTKRTEAEKPKKMSRASYKAIARPEWR
jgi:hypothetical protein